MRKIIRLKFDAPIPDDARPLGVAIEKELIQPVSTLGYQEVTVFYYDVPANKKERYEKDQRNSL